MDLNANDDRNQIDYAKVPLDALRQTAKMILARSLNPTKVFLSEAGIPRDWRGISYLAGLSSLYESLMLTDKDPINKVISLWRREGDNQTANFDNLLKFLGEIDRWDVADDLAESLAEDAKAYNSKKYQEKLIVERKEASKALEEFDRETCEKPSEILTTEDAINAQQGLPPQRYDAYLLYADEDFNFAMEVIERLESNEPQNNFKICVKDRDLIGGLAIEHEAIMRIISQRCDGLIVIVTKAFFKSTFNTYFINFGTALQIENRMKVIPLLMEPLVLPHPLVFYSSLKYFHHGKMFDFWEKLSHSLRSPPKINIVRALNNPVPSIDIQEIKEDECFSYQLPEKLSRKTTTDIRGTTSMSNLYLPALTDNNDNYASTNDLTSFRSLDAKSSRRTWLNKVNKFFSRSPKSGSKLDIPSENSVSVSVEKPKRKKSEKKKKLISEAT